jgi:hypothetical protein
LKTPQPCFATHTEIPTPPAGTRNLKTIVFMMTIPILANHREVFDVLRGLRGMMSSSNAKIKKMHKKKVILIVASFETIVSNMFMSPLRE